MNKLIILTLLLLLLSINCDIVNSTSISPKEVHGLINAEREKHGLPGVKWSNKMQQYAQSQSAAMAKADRMYHSNRYALQGGENVWSGTGHSWSASDVVQSWMNSSSHRAWLLDRRVKYAGVGVSQSSGSTYVAWAFEGR